ncbi:MAG: FAD-binding protein [Acidiferrobacterales bacterium]
MGSLRKQLSGWGRYPEQECITWRPEKQSGLVVESPMIARGLGRSYGDAALNESGNVVLTERVNRFLELDIESGKLRAEAGVSMAEVIDVCLPRGWFPQVTPGTKHVSLGGCLAADVHGKNHHRVGAFSSSVEAFNLITADGATLTCSRDENENVYRATVGGMGLTGVISEMTLQLKKVETAYVTSRHVKAADLDAAFNELAQGGPENEYSVAWIDCLSRGRKLGRSIIMQGRHASADELGASQQKLPLQVARRRHKRFPIDLPSWALNPLSISSFNSLYYYQQGRKTQPFISDIDRYFYPLDAVEDWNRMYGKKGFVQYQCVLPTAAAFDGIKSMLEKLANSRRASFLAVLKRLGPESGGLMSFPMEGYTLALDLPLRGKELFALLDELDEQVLAAGGRVYLAKDARLGAAAFAGMYPRLAEWQKIKSRIDPGNRFTSSLARRLGWVVE